MYNIVNMHFGNHVKTPSRKILLKTCLNGGIIWDYRLQ